MKNFKREQFEVLTGRMSEPVRFIQVITGPRQVGKTTLVNQFLKSSDIQNIYVSADNITDNHKIWLDNQWELARLKLKQSGSSEIILVIDEIQKIENWSEIVKKQWDYDRLHNLNIKVIILGSSALLLQKGLTESLAGRFEVLNMSHWHYNEINEVFGLSADEFVWFGAYPGSIDLIRDEDRWKRYIRDSLIETSISKDILMLNRIDKPALLKKLFELGSIYSGQILSLTKILGELQDKGNTATLSYYLDLLDKSGLLTGLEKFSKNTVRKRASIPKFQVYNTAFISSLSSLRFNEASNDPKYWGRMVESAIGAHLINYAQTHDIKVSYWRESNNEVDFIIEKNDVEIALEVKSGERQYNKGLEVFSKQFSPYKSIIIGKSGIPWQEFLTINPCDLF